MASARFRLSGSDFIDPNDGNRLSENLALVKDRALQITPGYGRNVGPDKAGGKQENLKGIAEIEKKIGLKNKIVDT